MQQIYEFLMQSQYFAPEEIAAQQRHQVEQLVRFARQNVKFYRKRLDVLFNWRDEFDFSRWQEVPILTRQDLLTQDSSMEAKVIPQGHGPVLKTIGSGSTGTPVETLHNGLIAWAAKASFFRSCAWHSLDYRRNFFSWGVTTVPEPGVQAYQVNGPWGPAWLPQSAQGKSYGLSHLQPVELALEIIKKHDTAYVDGRSTTLHALARAAIDNKVKHRLGALYSISTKLRDDTRELCLEAFGAKVINRYASKEAYDIGHQCPTSNDMHLNAELMLVEILNEENKPCVPGEMGRMIVTPFYNTAQPFIRYDLGDFVTVGEPCTCGRNLPVIKDIDGRTVHAFRLPNGRKVVPRLFTFARDCLGSAEWQIAQTAQEVVEMRYVKNREANPAAIARLTEVIRSQLTPETQVIYRPMASLPATPSGKILESICELPGD